MTKKLSDTIEDTVKEGVSKITKAFNWDNALRVKTKALSEEDLRKRNESRLSKAKEHFHKEKKFIRDFSKGESVDLAVVLSSSGPLWIYQLGVLSALSDSPHFNIKKLVGCSGGALASAAYASGNTTTPEMLAWVQECAEMSEDIGFKLAKLPFHILEMVMSCGLVDSNAFLNIAHKIIPEKIRMGDLETPLSVVAVDVNRGIERVFSHDENPDLPVASAVVASACIPGYFSPIAIPNQFLSVKQRKEAGIHTQKEVESSTQYIDGATASVFPIDAAKACNTCEDEELLTVGFTVYPSQAVYEKINVLNFFPKVFQTMLRLNQAEDLEDLELDHNVMSFFIDTPTTGDTPSLVATPEEAETMFDYGYRRAERFIKQMKETLQTPEVVNEQE